MKQWGLYALNGGKKAGINVRIAHAHNSRLIRDYKWPLKIFCKQFLNKSATNIWGCGRDAGIYFFGKDNWNKSGMIMRNAIELDRFEFNEIVRNKIREANGLANKTVIGHVGRFNTQKSHTRLLEIFAEYVKINPNSVLVMIGEGELEEEMKKKASELGITDKTLFTGLQSNVHEWYQAIDLFIMPSLFEGLSVVGIEAQATGLPALFSDAVTDEIVLSDNADRISLNESNKQWAKKMERMLANAKPRNQGTQIVREAGYDIVTESKRIQDLYLKMCNEG